MSKETPDVAVQPNFYGVLPADVRYDKSLSPVEKLLYVEIVSLTNSKGFCWASNQYFANLFGYSSSSHMSKLINKLEKAGHLKTIVDKDSGNKRIITIVNPIAKIQKSYSENSEHNNNKLIDKYTSEVDKQMQILHRRYVQMFKIDPTDWLQASTDKRSSLLQAALSRYKLTDARKTKIAARLKDGSFEMCHQALVNANEEDWNHGENDRGWKMDLYDYLFRNYEMVERWANKDDIGGRND